MADSQIQQHHLVLFQETIERSLGGDIRRGNFWKRCTALMLGMPEINQLVDFKRIYGVSARTVLRLLEGGATLQDVEVFLETRELLASEYDSISLAAIARFYHEFGDGLDSVDLVARITALQDELGTHFVGEAVDRTVSLVRSGAIYPEAALDFIMGSPECWHPDVYEGDRRSF